MEIKHLGYYNISKGWGNSNPNWHEFIIESIESSHHLWIQKVILYTNWIKDNIQKFERHSQWIVTHNKFIIRFRYERDLIWFKLTWS